MKTQVIAATPETVDADAIVLLLAESGPVARPKHPAIKGHAEAFSRSVAERKARAEWFCTLEKGAECRARHLLLDSATFGGWMPGREKLKAAAARAVETCRKQSLSRLAFLVDGPDAVANAVAIFEGVALGDFSDVRFKSSPMRRLPLSLTIVVEGGDLKAVRQAVKDREPVVEGVNLAREMSNAPNNVMTPEALASEARRIAKRTSMECSVMGARELEKRGYALITAVGRGSEHPPRLVTLRHRPKKARGLHVALVGKGICFDTGGLCIKPGDDMHWMNGDMNGAAAVLGTMHAIGSLKVPPRVTAIVPTAINAIDAAATLPGSIVKSKSGKTVFIDNTDAEGRLVLADAFAHAAGEKVDVMIDLATLTGAANVALGPAVAALFTDDAELRGTLMAASERTGDSAWPMPLWREYDGSLDHYLADVNNMSSIGRMGGAIHAANFLRRFVPNGVRWAHFDMSGPSRAKSRTRCFGVGATGWGVRLLVDALQAMAAKQS